MVCACDDIGTPWTYHGDTKRQAREKEGEREREREREREGIVYIQPPGFVHFLAVEDLCRDPGEGWWV